MEINDFQKKLIKDNPIFIGTATQDGKPNVTVVDGAEINSKDEILLMDYQTTTCKDNLLKTPMFVWQFSILREKMVVKNKGK